MVNSERYFYISGLLSLSIFALFFTLFVYLFITNTTTNQFALKKDNFISVSVVISQPKSAKKADKTLSSSSVTKKQDIDINDLFSDVWTQKIDTKHKSKQVNSKRIQQISKRIKTASKEDASPSLQQQISSAQQGVQSDAKSTSSGELVNEYLARIQAIVYDNFYPPANSQGNVVRVVIEIGPFGKLHGFRVLSYSGYEALNREVDKMQERLRRVVFPINPDKKSFQATINLIPENKE